MKKTAPEIKRQRFLIEGYYDGKEIIDYGISLYVWIDLSE